MGSKSFIWRMPSIRYWIEMTRETKKMHKTIIVFQGNLKKQNSKHDEL